jgi:hypothetical protein
MDPHSIRSDSVDFVHRTRWIDDPAAHNQRPPCFIPEAVLALINDHGIGNLTQWTG